MFEVRFAQLLNGLYRSLAVPIEKALGVLGNSLLDSISMVFRVLLWSFGLRWAALLCFFGGIWLLVSLLPAFYDGRIFTSLTITQLAGLPVMPFVVMAAAGLLRLGYPVFVLAAPIGALLLAVGAL